MQKLLYFSTIFTVAEIVVIHNSTASFWEDTTFWIIYIKKDSLINIIKSLALFVINDYISTNV